MIINANHVAHSKIIGIQYARAIAVGLVVLTHTDGILALPTMFGTQLFAGLLYNGAVGVDLFFVISGFIITIVSLQPSSVRPRLTLTDYAAKRFARIMPFLWLCVITYALVRFAGTGKFEAAPYLTALFLWPLGEVRPPVVWSLRHEALFYAVFALSFLGSKPRPYVLFLWCVSPLIVGLLPDISDAKQHWLHELGRFLFNPSNLTFGYGVVLGFIYQMAKTRQVLPRFSPFGMTVLLSAACAALFFTFRGFGAAHTNVLAFLAVLISLLIPATAGGMARIGHVLGDASYSIYLTHPMVILIGGAAWIAVIGPKYLPVALVLLCLASLCCGVLVYYWVERPMVRYAQRLLQAVRCYRHTHWQKPIPMT